LLIEQCQSRDELPEFLVTALERINELLLPAVEDETEATDLLAGEAEPTE